MPPGWYHWLAVQEAERTPMVQRKRRVQLRAQAESMVPLRRRLSLGFRPVRRWRKIVTVRQVIVVMEVMVNWSLLAFDSGPCNRYLR